VEASEAPGDDNMPRRFREEIPRSPGTPFFYLQPVSTKREREEKWQASGKAPVGTKRVISSTTCTTCEYEEGRRGDTTQSGDAFLPSTTCEYEEGKRGEGRVVICCVFDGHVVSPLFLFLKYTPPSLSPSLPPFFAAIRARASKA